MRSQVFWHYDLACLGLTPIECYNATVDRVGRNEKYEKGLSLGIDPGKLSHPEGRIDLAFASRLASLTAKFEKFRRENLVPDHVNEKMYPTAEGVYLPVSHRRFQELVSHSKYKAFRLSKGIEFNSEEGLKLDLSEFFTQCAEIV